MYIQVSIAIAYPMPCQPMNFWVVLLLLYLFLGLMLHFELSSCSDYVVVLIIVHDKIIVLIGTWSLA
jgi:hypothetical protein